MPVRHTVVMTYVRPSWPRQDYRDAAGEVIDYGHRWGMGSPPQDTYSVVTHPQRFAPVVAVTHALVAHLEDTYDVTVTVDGERTVLDPGPRRARLVFAVSTDASSVRVDAGVWSMQAFPFCGCDACDEDVEALVSDMEQYVFAVVAGGLSEVRSRSEVTISLYGVRDDDLTTISTITAHRLDRGERREARRNSALVPPRWLPWIPRTEAPPNPSAVHSNPNAAFVSGDDSDVARQAAATALTQDTDETPSTAILNARPETDGDAP